MQPAPVFLPAESPGQRNLAGYSLWGCKDSDTTEQLLLTQRYCYPYCAYHLRISQAPQLNLFKALSHLDWEQLWTLLSPSFQFIITPYAKSLLIPSSFLHLCCHHPSPRHHHFLPEPCSYLIILLHTSRFHLIHCSV